MPPLEIPLPRSVQAVLRTVPIGGRHPGLQLDKFLTPCPQQEQQRDVLAEVASTPGYPELLTELRARRTALLKVQEAVSWQRTTAGPLTLHLARASALENAGLCLHPVYGFAYLPGSGLKGLARAYAETVWLSAQPDPKTAWRAIEAVFGWAPGSDMIGKDERGKPLVKPWKPREIPEHNDAHRAAAGQIVFHDAWPAAWPRLFVDIVNNRHPTYYRGEDAPGDWDSPNPVYFLAVTPGTSFEFALARRRGDAPTSLLDLTREWLEGGLLQFGVGAKTAAGYGLFLPSQATKTPGPAPSSPALSTFSATLELATPAFLAGAGRQPDDCNPRAATLRGQLRWWWRAMHAGFVDRETLRRLEGAVWGDTTAGGSVRIEVRPLGPLTPVLYDKHAEARKNDLAPPPDRKTTPGLWYHTYGMHDGGKQRRYLPQGTKWMLVFRVRDGVYSSVDGKGKPLPGTERRIDKSILLEQAQAALWWLCVVGGVGSKSRKGFGNLDLPPELGDFAGGRFVSKGRELRAACGLPDQGFNPAWAESPAIRQMVDLGRAIQPSGDGWVQLSIRTTNVWQALDAVGMTAQQFAKRYRHQRQKGALGLPRRIGPPAQGQFRPGSGVKDRHASPVHYHLHRLGDAYWLRIAAFPAVRLPSLEESKTMLSELLHYFVDQYPSED